MIRTIFPVTVAVCFVLPERGAYSRSESSVEGGPQGFDPASTLIREVGRARPHGNTASSCRWQHARCRAPRKLAAKEITATEEIREQRRLLYAIRARRKGFSRLVKRQHRKR